MRTLVGLGALPFPKRSVPRVGSKERSQRTGAPRSSCSCDSLAAERVGTCSGCASPPKTGRVSYHQASASWSAGGRPCPPAVPRCVVIVGKGPWSNEQRLRAVISQAVRSGALSARHGAVLRYPWALGTCSPLVRVTFAIFVSLLRSGAHVECAGAPVLLEPKPHCDLHCARA